MPSSSTLFSTPSASITQHPCRPHDAGCGGEEHADRDEVVFVQRGVFLKHVGRRTVTANPNHIVFFNRGEPYRVSHPVAGGDDCLVLTLNRPMLDSVLSECDPAACDRAARPFAVPNGPCSAGLFLAHSEFVRRIRAGELTDVGVEEAALSLARAALAHAHAIRGLRTRQPRVTTHAAHRDLAEAVEHLLSADYRSPMSLAEIARRVHASPYHLCRVFRQHVGLSIHAYRNHLRLRTALTALADRGRDLSRLALSLGYADHSHFSNQPRP